VQAGTSAERNSMRKMQDRLIREEGRTNYHQQIRVYGFSLCWIESGKRKTKGKRKEKKKKKRNS
jgi:hypothetical protein